MLTHPRPAYSLATTPAAFASAIMFMVISLALCISATAMARWDRSSGSNALVLQAREEALRAEQAKQRILAANMERDRISESIQSEVTMTLTRQSCSQAASRAPSTLTTGCGLVEISSTR